MPHPHRSRTRHAVLMAVLAATGLALAACAAPAEPEPGDDAGGVPADGGTLTIGIHADPGTLDPTFASTFTSVSVFNAMCEQLYAVDADGRVTPQLADGEPEFDDEGRVATVRLREGVRFQDGTPFDAAAVKATLDRYLTAEGSQRTNELDALAEVAVVDEHTVELHLSGPIARGVFDVMFTDRAGIMLSPTAFEAAGADFERAPVCVGPFEFSSRVAQDSVVLVPDDEYYDRDEVHLDELVYRVIPDTSVRATNLLSGDIDVMEKATPTELAVLEGGAGVRVEQFPSLGYYNLEINIGNVAGATEPPGQRDTPLATDARIREALALSLDREALNAAVFGGAYAPACGFMAPSSPLASEQTLGCDAPDPERAAELLAEAGVETPFRIELMLNQQPEFRRLAEAIRSMAGEAGFDVVLDVQESTTAVDRGYAGDFEMYLNSWSGRIDPDANISLFAMSSSPRSMSKYHDADVDRLLVEARSSLDDEARVAAYDELDRRLDRDRPYVYLVRPTNLIGVRDGVLGLEYRPNGSVIAGRAGFAETG
ncbi:ABC transporter substrate-binding protein [Agromyces mediolanus]|uniref:ABC transporter substrate-binding protein n=1 Tax=Agromyces mediolanus TaxID=41986 RepID=UPI0020419595|nr:ABC transporter substrate-binding protein [Agromyces mediolanus]MCM3657783.1 ABC transporter substrate-binding protein [Agromyces mediolanus]